MKRRRATPRDVVNAKGMQAQIIMLQQVVGALVARAGGYVEISSKEMDGNDGDRIDFHAGDSGVRIKLNRTIKVVSSLN